MRRKPITPEAYRLRVAESHLFQTWILWAIDALDADRLAALSRMSPVITEAFGPGSTWQSAVEQRFSLPQGFREEVVRIWSLRREDLEAAGEPIVPSDFPWFLRDLILSQTREKS